MTLLPFFTYYGGKWRIAPRYPPPEHPMIIEPFAGAAGYSLRYPARAVILNDIEPMVAGTWDYLIRADEGEILALPDLKPGQDTDDLRVPQEAKWLIGWWLNKGSAVPKKRASSFMLRHPEGAPYWGAEIRRRIAGQQRHIRHWQVTCGDYRDLPGYDGTWFTDPPYQQAGQYYRNSEIDYGELAQWCHERGQQVIACEADGASWLPFSPLAGIDGTEGSQKKSRARLEVMWTNGSTGRLF